MYDNDNNGILATTIEIWTPRLARKLTSEDSRQILVNVTGFAGIIAEWARNEAAVRPVADNDNVRTERNKSALLSQQSEQGTIQ